MSFLKYARYSLGLALIELAAMPFVEFRFGNIEVDAADSVSLRLQNGAPEIVQPICDF